MRGMGLYSFEETDRLGRHALKGVFLVDREVVIIVVVGGLEGGAR